MRVLWVSAEPPDRSLGGGNIRQAHLLAAVADRHETHLLLAGTVTDDLVRSRLAGLVVVPAAQSPQPRQVWRRRLLDLRLAGPEGPPERYGARRARGLLRDRLPAGGYDGVVRQHGGLAALL